VPNVNWNFEISALAASGIYTELRPVLMAVCDSRYTNFPARPKGVVKAGCGGHEGIVTTEVRSVLHQYWPTTRRQPGAAGDKALSDKVPITVDLEEAFKKLPSSE
jgi:hypothetical protein